MDESFPIIETGVIHGRFQVLHNDHMTYLMAGKRLCRHLVVGITNPDPFMVREESADPNRGTESANPLTYYERYQLVRTGLEEAGVAPDQFSVVPLPINLQDRYKYYVPMDAVFFLSIYDDWGRKKLEYLKSLRLKTHVLWEVTPQEKGISGNDVRRRMRDGLEWEHLVPFGVSILLKEWDIPERLRRLHRKEHK